MFFDFSHECQNYCSFCCEREFEGFRAVFERGYCLLDAELWGSECFVYGLFFEMVQVFVVREVFERVFD